MKFFKTAFLAFGMLLAFLGLAHADPSCVYSPRGGAVMAKDVPGTVPILHGINLSSWWQDTQDRALSVNEIRQIYDSGFDFVRLPVSPSWLELKDEAQQKEKLQALRCDIISLLNENLMVVLDLHASDTYQALLAHDPNEAVPHLEQDWRKLQQVIEGLPTKHILLSLYNEPLIDTGTWWRLQGRIMEDLRTFFPDNTFVVASGPFDGWWQLITKKPYDDGNVVYDFHFYDPLVFTHHGASWVKSEQRPLSPIVYPVNKNFAFDLSDPEIKKYVDQGWDRSAIYKAIQEVVKWRDYYRVKVVCLEFGVYREHVDEESRFNWLHDVRETLEDARIPWAVWEYRGPFSILDTQGKNLDKSMLSALALKPNPIP